MEPAPRTRAHDPDLDPSPGRRPPGPGPYFAENQRLVANPFLALAALVPWVAAVRLALLQRNLPLFLLLLASLLLIGGLLQFHCLDCGRTGMLLRWRRHACERSIARQLAGRRRRLRGPNPTTQTMLWMYVVVAVTLLWLLAARSRR